MKSTNIEAHQLDGEHCAHIITIWLQSVPHYFIYHLGPQGPTFVNKSAEYQVCNKCINVNLMVANQ